jgi:peptide deformylase
MVATMREYGGVGLAAPQVHEAIRLCVIELDDHNGRYQLDISQPLLILFNPIVKVLDAAPFGFWEGCLSVPGLRGYVERPSKIQVSFLDGRGQPQSLIAEDFLSTVFQHEIDHIDGRLYVDKIKDPARFSFVEEYQRYHMEGSADDVE